MTIRPIRSEKDYQEALAEMKRLWGAKSRTEEGDRLDVLSGGHPVVRRIPG
jgi:HTH-type transcriptional regulator / antitoxin HigA